MAYNQGPAAVYQALSGEIPFSIEYNNKVLRSYYRFVKVADRLGQEG